MIASCMTQLIGNTPLLRLPLRRTNWQLWLKLEKFNPGQSMKDRMALSMIRAAERAGELKPGGTIIESSSGNTGTGLAIVAAERGYKFIAVVDHHAAEDKILTMKAYGAEIVYVQGDFNEKQVATFARETLAEQLAQQLPNAVFLGQADNPANSLGYYKTLAEELISNTGGELDVLIGAIGTGGSLCGTGRRLKEVNPGVQVIGVEPEGSIIFGGSAPPYYQSGTGTPGGVEVGKNVDYSLLDLGLKVSDSQAFNTARFLARNHGILIGGSAGGVIYKALEWIHQQPNSGLAVVIVCDGGEKYLKTIFDDEWMKQRNLLDPIIDTLLNSMVERVVVEPLLN